MSVCRVCGKEISDDSSFCGHCGAAVNAPTPREFDRSVQEECLNTFYSRLRTERKCWRIFSFVFLGFTLLFVFFAFVFFGIGMSEGDAFMAGFLGGFYISYGFILFLPVCIADFIIAAKVSRYIESVYSDCGPAITRSGSVGAIVLGALFNTIAMIFIIINFIYIKRNRAVFEQIRINQTGKGL